MENLRSEEIGAQIKALREQYENYKSRGLKLDMSRGKPCKEQLDLSEGLLSVVVKNDDCVSDSGFDYRNYGLLEGIPEIKKIFADIFEVDSKEVIVGGNSSLNMMYDTLARAMMFGVYGSEKPWSEYGKISFICIVPGYDRHFGLTEHMGINMINVPMLSGGPDMDMVEKLVSGDDTIKGIWCVPKYSNPDGITYSDETVKRLAALKPKAKDFRIMWDNAYALHDFGQGDKLLPIFSEAKKNGNEDMIYMFASTSKITYPGAGVAAMAASEKNIEDIKKHVFFQTIGPDKINQLRHVKFFKDLNGMKEQMKKHAAIIKPRFDAVLEKLDKNLKGIANWNIPNGGYFVSLNVPCGCAKKVINMLKEAGVAMTGAGATFPYKNDPDDKNIRISPTYPPVDELKTAMDLLCICVKIAYLEQKEGKLQ